MGTVMRLHKLKFAVILNQITQRVMLLSSFAIIGGIMGGVGFSYMSQINEISSIVRMAKIGNGGLIESPELLETRLKFPEAYSDEAIEACGGGQERDLRRYIKDTIKIAGTQGDSSMATIKVTLKADIGVNCVKQLVSMIGAQQEAMVGKELKLKQLQLDSLKQAQLDAVKSGGRQVDIGAFQFLVKESLITNLHQRILDLEDSIQQTKYRRFEQVGPISVTLAPNSPRFLKMVLLGGMAGLMLGMLLVIFMAGRKVGAGE